MAEWDGADDTRSHDKPASLREMYGDILVVTASFDLLMKFLLNNLSWYAKKESLIKKDSLNHEGDAGKIVTWAKNLLDRDAKEINYHRELLRNLIKDSCENRGKAADIFRCVIRRNDDNEEYIYSKWMSSKTFVSEEIQDENTLSLYDARASHLLDQICYRLRKLIISFENNSSCPYDLEVKDRLDEIYKYFDERRLESIQMVKDFETFMEERSLSYQSNIASRTTKPEEKKSKKKKIEEPMRPCINSIPASATKPVTSGVSFAAMLMKDKEAATKTDSNMQPKTDSKMQQKTDSKMHPKTDSKMQPKTECEEPKSETTSKKAAKRAARKQKISQKNEMKSEEKFIDLTMEEPTNAMEVGMCDNNTKCATKLESCGEEPHWEGTSDDEEPNRKTKIPVPEECDRTHVKDQEPCKKSAHSEQSIPESDEIVMMDYITFIDGKPVTKNMLIKKSELDKIKKIGL